MDKKDSWLVITREVSLRMTDGGGVAAGVEFEHQGKKIGYLRADGVVVSTSPDYQVAFQSAAKDMTGERAGEMIWMQRVAITPPAKMGAQPEYGN